MNMWEKKEPKYGDQIRVNRGFYYHHGIYISNDSIIHFAPMGRTDMLDPSSAMIIDTSLEEFLKGGILEVRTYTKQEEQTRRAPKEIVECAKSHLGEKGYDLISNNCEHFSNFCAFGTKKSAQVENIFSMIFKR